MLTCFIFRLFFFFLFFFFKLFFFFLSLFLLCFLYFTLLPTQIQIATVSHTWTLTCAPYQAYPLSTIHIHSHQPSLWVSSSNTHLQPQTPWLCPVMLVHSQVTNQAKRCVDGWSGWFGLSLFGTIDTCPWSLSTPEGMNG